MFELAVTYTPEQVLKHNVALAKRLFVAEAPKVEKEFSVRVLNKTAEGGPHFVYGAVLVPDDVDDKGNPVDLQGDLYSAEEVEQAAENFMADYQQVGLVHKGILASDQAVIVQSFIAPADFELEGAVKIKKGTWIMKVRILADALWKDVETGKLRGFSIGGFGVRVPEPETT